MLLNLIPGFYRTVGTMAWLTLIFIFLIAATLFAPIGGAIAATSPTLNMLGNTFIHIWNLITGAY